jgi:hypothetical protein
MGRDRAAMVFADPPTIVQVASVVGRGKIKHREFASASGEMSALNSLDPHQYPLPRRTLLGEGSIHYVCMDWRTLARL